MKCARELKRELPLLYKRGKLELRDISYLFGKVREILEHKAIYKNNYPELNLFCNWCSHIRLSSSNTIYRALFEISKAASEATNVKIGNDAGDMTNKFIDVCGNVLNIPRVRLGLKAVLEEQKIDSRIAVNKKWWDACLQLFLLEVSEKPIEFPQKVIDGTDTKSKAAKIYNKILELPNSLNHDKIISLKVMLEEKSPLFNGENGYSYHITSISGITYVVVVQGKEDENAF